MVPGSTSAPKRPGSLCGGDCPNEPCILDLSAPVNRPLNKEDSERPPEAVHSLPPKQSQRSCVSNMDFGDKLLGIMKTELKLLPHLETKPSSQPQEFQACQPTGAAGQGGVSCALRSLHPPTQTHTQDLCPHRRQPVEPRLREGKGGTTPGHRPRGRHLLRALLGGLAFLPGTPASQCCLLLTDRGMVSSV